MNQPLLKCEHVDFGYENYDVVKDVSMGSFPGIISASSVRTETERVR